VCAPSAPDAVVHQHHVDDRRARPAAADARGAGRAVLARAHHLRGLRAAPRQGVARAARALGLSAGRGAGHRARATGLPARPQSARRASRDSSRRCWRRATASRHWRQCACPPW
jgi:hypothetical protein